MVEGFRFVLSQRVILGIFLLDTNAMVFGMPSALFPALAEHTFEGGATSSASSTRLRTRARSRRRCSRAG